VPARPKGCHGSWALGWPWGPPWGALAAWCRCSLAPPSSRWAGGQGGSKVRCPPCCPPRDEQVLQFSQFSDSPSSCRSGCEYVQHPHFPCNSSPVWGPVGATPYATPLVQGVADPMACSEHPPVGNFFGKFLAEKKSRYDTSHVAPWMTKFRIFLSVGPDGGRRGESSVASLVEIGCHLGLQNGLRVLVLHWCCRCCTGGDGT